MNSVYEIDGDIHIEHFNLHKKDTRFIGDVIKQKFWISAWQPRKGEKNFLNGFFYAKQYINGKANGKDWF